MPEQEPPGGWWREFGADTAAESEDAADRFRDWLVEERGYEPDRVEIMYSQQAGGHSGDLWEVREGGLGSTAFPPDGKDHWPGWEDSAVPPERSETTSASSGALRRIGYQGALYGHFGQG